MSNYKLGSLFDGSGGFPLAGTLCGIEPVWAAEIEPYPIAVTRSRFPKMKHLGDISKINGAEIEPVDIITFGSPCQDLSVAGKRAGLKHTDNGDDETTRSGLFMEAVRIIKEMRRATNGKYPTFALWENVPGAFSSNKGEDFRVVCEEIIKIAEPSATMPEVPQKGWNYADSYCGDGWSIAYRVLDAQYWGVPQRRRRIYLVADFGGQRAREVLFEREGLRGYFTQSRTPWQGITADAEGSSGADDREGEGIKCFNPWDSQTRRCYGVNGIAPSLCAGAETSGQNQQSFLVPDSGEGDVAYTLKIRSGCEGGGKGALVQKDKSATLATNNDQYLFQPLSVENHPSDSRVSLDDSGRVQCLTSRMGTGGGNVPMVMEPKLFENHGQEVRFTGPLKVAPTAQAGYGEGGSTKPLVIEQIANFIDVEMEVAVRKYDVDADKLVKVLRDHKGSMTNKAIAEALNCPITQVEHWFRTDNCFAVPDPDVWFRLKDLLGITTEEFDKSIMTFEYKGGNYDMRNRIHLGDTAPTLTCGSGNALHLLPSEPIAFAANQRDEVRDLGDKAGTLQAEPGMKQQTFIAETQPVICLQGNGIDRADTAGCNGKGWREDQSYTLNTLDRPAVVFAIDQQGGKGGANYAENIMPTICSDSHGTPHGVAYQDKVGSLCLSDYKGVGNQYINDDKAVVEKYTHEANKYIVRRLTPTECARLQGFADHWGHIDRVKHFSAEDYELWKDVRNTHAAINGKAVKDYTEKQMVAWYNKLHTDSSEYKMWGNGIALPTALYVLQGIADAFAWAEFIDG